MWRSSSLYFFNYFVNFPLSDMLKHINSHCTSLGSTVYIYSTMRSQNVLVIHSLILLYIQTFSHSSLLMFCHSRARMITWWIWVIQVMWMLFNSLLKCKPLCLISSWITNNCLTVSLAPSYWVLTLHDENGGKKNGDRANTSNRE